MSWRPSPCCWGGLDHVRKAATTPAPPSSALLPCAQRAAMIGEIGAMAPAGQWAIRGGTMKIHLLIKAAAILFAAQVMAVGQGAAQEKYPSRPIEFIVPWGPGGGADQLARKMAALLEPELKISLPVVNVPGATGSTGMTKMLAAANDGHSISIFIADTF